MIRLVAAGVETLLFILGLVWLVTYAWHVPQVAPFWPEVGYVFAFIGIALAQVGVVMLIILGRPRR